jgi:hypothetical protein
MQTVTLSEEALNLLKLRAGIYPAKEEDRTRAAYDELTEAGLMTLDPTLAVRTGFRLTEEGWRLANSLAAAEYLSRLSDQALHLLQSHLAAIGSKNGDPPVYPSDRTREAYRELARAGMMDAYHSFTRGPESVYRITEEAYNRREELMAIQRPRFVPSAWARRIFRALSLMGNSVSGAS